MPARHNRRGGFTLLELVISLAMVGWIALSIYASMGAAFRASTHAEAVIEPSRTAAVAMDLIRTDLQNGIGAAGLLAGTFEGAQAQDDRGHEADDLVFFSTADSPQHLDGNGEIKQVELTVVRSANGADHLLVRRVTRNLLAALQPQPDDEVLCRGVTSFSLRYFDGSNWQETWDSTQQDNTMPAAVEVTLQLERPDRPTLSYVHVFPLSCSTAAQDPAVNTGVSLP